MVARVPPAWRWCLLMIPEAAAGIRRVPSRKVAAAPMWQGIRNGCGALISGSCMTPEAVTPCFPERPVDGTRRPNVRAQIVG